MTPKYPHTHSPPKPPHPPQKKSPHTRPPAPPLPPPPHTHPPPPRAHTPRSKQTPVSPGRLPARERPPLRPKRTEPARAARLALGGRRPSRFDQLEDHRSNARPARPTLTSLLTTGQKFGRSNRSPRLRLQRCAKDPMPPQHIPVRPPIPSGFDHLCDHLFDHLSNTGQTILPKKGFILSTNVQ